MSEPSVGDLLAAADRDARRLQGQAEASDGPSLAAGYAGVLHAALEVLSAIPHPSVGPPAATDRGDYLTVRVSQMVAHVDRFKPLTITPHPGPARIADTLQHAGALLRRHAHQAMAHDPEARADAAAARVRVARTLAAVAHVTGRELQGYDRQLQQSEQPQRKAPPRQMHVSPVRTNWIPMLQRHEHLTLDYLGGHLSDLAGEHLGATPDSAVLHAGLGAWSVLAIRRAAHPAVSATDLHHIAATQAVVVQAAGALAGAAIDRGELDAAAGPHLLRRLDEAAAQWAHVAGQWAQLRTPDAARADPSTTSGSAAVIGVVDAATITDAASWARPQQVEQRLGGAVVPVLRTITENSAALAEIYQHLPEELAGNGRLRAPAALLLHIATENETRRNQQWSRPGSDASFRVLPVTMHDVARNRLLPLTAGARQLLDNAGAKLLTATAQAHQALHAATPSWPAQPGPTRATPGPRPGPRHPPHHPPPRTPGPSITF